MYSLYLWVKGKWQFEAQANDLSFLQRKAMRQSSAWEIRYTANNEVIDFGDGED